MFLNIFVCFLYDITKIKKNLEILHMSDGIWVIFTAYYLV